jgi:choline kinase
MGDFLAAAMTTDEEALLAVDTQRNLTDESMKVSLTPDGALANIGKVDIEDPRGEYIGMLMARGSVLAAFRDELEAFVGRPESANEWYERAMLHSARGGARWHAWPTPDSRWVEIDDDADHAAAAALVEPAGR